MATPSHAHSSHVEKANAYQLISLFSFSLKYFVDYRDVCNNEVQSPNQREYFPKNADMNSIVNGGFEDWFSTTNLMGGSLKAESSISQETGSSFKKEGQYSAKLNGGLYLSCQNMNQFTSNIYFQGWIYDNSPSWDVTIYFYLCKEAAPVLIENISTSSTIGWQHLEKTLNIPFQMDDTTYVLIEQNGTYTTSDYYYADYLTFYLTTLGFPSTPQDLHSIEQNLTSIRFQWIESHNLGFDNITYELLQYQQASEIASNPELNPTDWGSICNITNNDEAIITDFKIYQNFSFVLHSFGQLWGDPIKYYSDFGDIFTIANIVSNVTITQVNRTTNAVNITWDNSSVKGSAYEIQYKIYRYPHSQFTDPNIDLEGWFCQDSASERNSSFITDIDNCTYFAFSIQVMLFVEFDVWITSGFSTPILGEIDSLFLFPTQLNHTKTSDILEIQVVDYLNYPVSGSLVMVTNGTEKVYGLTDSSGKVNITCPQSINAELQCEAHKEGFLGARKNFTVIFDDSICETCEICEPSEECNSNVCESCSDCSSNSCSVCESCNECNSTSSISCNDSTCENEELDNGLGNKLFDPTEIAITGGLIVSTITITALFLKKKRIP